MLDAFEHERGKLYPSWQDNPRLKWARALREMNIGQSLQFNERYRVRRAEWSWQIWDGSALLNLGDAIGKIPDREKRIEAIVDWLLEREGTEAMETQLSIPSLTTKALNALRAIRVDPLARNHDGRTVHALRAKGLIENASGGKLAITNQGQAALAREEHLMEQPVAQRSVMHEHVPDPERLLPAPEPYTPAVLQPPSPELPPNTAPDEPQDVGETVETTPPPTAEADERTFDLIVAVDPAFPDVEPIVIQRDPASDDGRAQRILDYLCDTSPFIRKLVEQLESVDRATERLRNLE